MKTEIVFGDRWIGVEFPDTAEFVSPGYGLAKLEAEENQEKAVENAVKNPLDIKPISDFVRKSWRITIASDGPTDDG